MGLLSPPGGGPFAATRRCAYYCHPEVGLLIYATRRWACLLLLHMPPGSGLAYYYYICHPEVGLPYATQRWASLCHPEVGFLMPPGGGLPYATRRWASLCHPEVDL